MSKIPEELLDTIQNCSYQELMTKLPDSSIDVLFTDPPYNLMIDGEEWDKDFDLEEWLKLVLPKIKKDGMFIIFNTKDNIDRIIAPFIESYSDDDHIFSVLSTIDWGKINPRQNVDPYRQHEFALFGINSAFAMGEQERDVNRIFQASFSRGNIVWDTSTELDIFRLHDEEKKKHPTAKPIRLLSDLIMKRTRIDDVILDTSSGTGSIPIASYYMCHHFVACEINKKYADDSNERLNQIKDNVPRSVFVSNAMAMDSMVKELLKPPTEEEILNDEPMEDPYVVLKRKFADYSAKDLRKLLTKSLFDFEQGNNLNEDEKKILKEIDIDAKDSLDYMELLLDANSYAKSTIFGIHNNLYEVIGELATEMNLYPVESTLKELRTLLGINNWYLGNGDRKKKIEYLKQKINNIPSILGKEKGDVTMKNILFVFRRDLYKLGIMRLADDLFEHYYRLKGWKMLNAFSTIKNINERNESLRNNYANLNEYPKEVTSLQILEDFHNYQRYIIECMINKSPKDYKEMATFYYRLLIDSMIWEADYTLDFIDVLDVYNKLINEGFYNKTIEEPIRNVISFKNGNKDSGVKVGRNDWNGTYIVRKLHITENKALKYNLRNLYLYTLPQGTKYKIINGDESTIPKSFADIKKEQKIKDISKGSEIKTYLDRGLTIQETAEEIGLSRRLVSDKYKKYVLNEYKKRNMKSKSDSEFMEFANEMHFTLYKATNLTGYKTEKERKQ